MERLAALLQDLVNVLESEGSDFWARWMREALELIKTGDYRGLDHFLSAFGGMGSFNDCASSESLAIAYPANSLARDLLRNRSFSQHLVSAWPTSLRGRVFAVLGIFVFITTIVALAVALVRAASG